MRREVALLDIILRLMTTRSVFVGAAAVYAAIRNHNHSINTQIFLAYPDRLQSIRRSMRGGRLLRAVLSK